jgi:predicted RNA-binding protein YlqC (UPF0109 family)
MGVRADIKVSERENGGINVSLSGNGMGVIIGRRGRRWMPFSIWLTTASTEAVKSIRISALTRRITAAREKIPWSPGGKNGRQGG